MAQFTLPGRLNFQTSPRDLTALQAYQKILYPQRIPTPFFYPASPYGLRGLGDCIPYDFYALQQAFGVTDCTVPPYSSDPGSQYACQQTNAPLLAKIAALSPSWGVCITPDMVPASYNPAPVGTSNPYANPYSGPGLLYNPADPNTPSNIYVGYSPIGQTGGIPNSTPIYYPTTPPATGGTTPPPTGATYAPIVSFTPSRSGILYPGDTWAINIRGGAPRTAVSVYGGPNGAFQTNQMGSTDQNGNFSLQGTIDNTMYGQSWQETWYVGSQNAGSFGFSIAQAPTGGGTTPPISGGTQPPAYSPPASGSQPPAGGGTPPPATSTDWIPGVSNTMVMVGGGALLLMMMMGGRR